jgi:hypothetical protein
MEPVSSKTEVMTIGEEEMVCRRERKGMDESKGLNGWIPHPLREKGRHYNCMRLILDILD